MKKESWEERARREIKEFDKGVRREGFWFNKSFSISAHQENYRENKNSIFLLRAFIESVKCKEEINQSEKVEFCYPIPYWIIIELYDVFKKYINVNVDEKSIDEKSISLDRLLGLTKGKGQSPALKMAERRQRDLNLMMDMNILIRKGLSDVDAALVAYEHNLGSSSPNPNKIKDMYYNEGWKKRLQGPRLYSPRLEKELLQIAPKALQRKFPDIKALQKKYPKISW